MASRIIVLTLPHPPIWPDAGDSKPKLLFLDISEIPELMNPANLPAVEFTNASSLGECFLKPVFFNYQTVISRKICIRRRRIKSA
jgi:hypothetical protein